VSQENESLGLPSPDGKYLVGWKGNKLSLFPVDGSTPSTIREHAPDSAVYSELQWSTDGKALYVYPNNGLPLKIYRLDMATGKMILVRQLVPADRAGVENINPLVLTPDGSEVAYSYLQTLSSLYVISGLR
jgi:hypothetical protein